MRRRFKQQAHKMHLVALCFCIIFCHSALSECSGGSGGDWGDYNITALATSKNNVTFKFEAKQFIGGNYMGWIVDRTTDEVGLPSTLKVCSQLKPHKYTEVKSIARISVSA